MAALAPKDKYDRILELGCSSGHYTYALAETYPGSEITGVDLSIRMLQDSQRLANQHVGRGSYISVLPRAQALAMTVLI